jgi:tRNA nucleotidyltransferase (CCA-adding enzyme)
VRKENPQKQKNLPVPKNILDIAKEIKDAGFEAYLAGGCVRDLILSRKPQDWDIATNALPEQIIDLFEKTFYENDFGTVGVISENVSDETLKVVEITPYRTEGKYSDSRRPDKVTFGTTLEKDLSRRDFTINAIALDPNKGHVIDPYNGQKDIKDKIIRAVENPKDRFEEDNLRILRAIRISTELGFDIEKETKKAIRDSASFTGNISQERIRDEFIKIIMSPRPVEGLILSQELGVLKHFLPELERAIKVKQNKAHAYDVWTHLLRSLAHSVKRRNGLEVRLAVLFHDISKPEARRWSEEKKDWTFYGHDVIGSRETERILKRLRFPVKLIEKVVKLVRWHMFFSDTEKITLSAVRRLVAKVGKENIWDLMEVRMCDRIGTGRPKESPYRLRKYQSMIEEVMADPISVSMLKINGKKIMDVTRETSGPRIGHILHALLEEVLDDPTLNKEGYLENKAKKLAKLPEKELEKVGKKGKEKKTQELDKTISNIRDKYWVK